MDNFEFWLDVGYPNRNRSLKVPVEENLYLKACLEIDKWALMGSAWPVIYITVAYLIFVLYIGPVFMKNRQPYNIKYFVALYDLYQAIYNACFVVSILTLENAAWYFWNHSCHPIEPIINPLWTHFNKLGWYLLISKLADLLDTVFFVLRKKQSHVTFLHVYHHAFVALNAWLFVKYHLGEQGILLAWLNSLIHTIMYSYYFLSTLGPWIRPYLWWKKYLTTLQILQFCIGLTYGVILVFKECDIPQFLYTYGVINGIIFLLLFCSFYYKTYIIKKNN